MKKRIVAMTLAAIMAASLVACGGSDASQKAGSGAAQTESDGTGEAAEDVAITIFNSKPEVQDQFVAMAEKYSRETGVDVEVFSKGTDTVASQLATKYAANDPFTIAMTDPTDIYALAGEYGADLSDEKWVENTDYAISVDGKVVGFPFCLEGRGIIYNADAIEAITGETFDPTKYETLDAFKGLLDELVAGGMEAPVGIMKEDWSLSVHFLGETYEQKEDTDAAVEALLSGNADLVNDEKFNSLMDAFDVLKEYNYAADSPVAAEREVSEQKLAEGEIAFMFGGNWDWSMINQYEYSENMGMMPVPQNTTDGTNTKLVGGGTKFMMIDGSENTSDAQRQAAKDFLNWLVFEDEGNAFLSVECAVVPAFSNVSATALDPLSTSVKSYADAGNMIAAYDHNPDDFITMCGGIMQMYLAGETDRAGLAAELEKYWSTAKIN